MFDRTNLQYGEMEADEVPYAMVTFNGSNYYLSNKGVATDRCYDDWTSNMQRDSFRFRQRQGQVV